MKRLIISGLIILSIFLTGCGNNYTYTPPPLHTEDVVRFTVNGYTVEMIYGLEEMEKIPFIIYDAPSDSYAMMASDSICSVYIPPNEFIIITEYPGNTAKAPGSFDAILTHYEIQTNQVYMGFVYVNLETDNGIGGYCTGTFYGQFQYIDRTYIIEDGYFNIKQYDSKEVPPEVLGMITGGGIASDPPPDYTEEPTLEPTIEPTVPPPA